MFSLEDQNLPCLFTFLFWGSRDRWDTCKIWGLFRLTDFLPRSCYCIVLPNLCLDTWMSKLRRKCFSIRTQTTSDEP